MGKNIAHAGAVGDGQTCKVVNQITAYAHGSGSINML